MGGALDSVCRNIGRIASAALSSPLKISIVEPYLDMINSARKHYLEEASKREVYGYCTGLGELFEKREAECPEGWERIVLEEHSTQTGAETVRPGYVRLFLLTRLLQLLKAPAPVRPEVALRIEEAINHDILPAINPNGSVGASGDLSPSAQAFLCLYYGKGTAYYDGRLTPCSEALKEAGLPAISLDRGEALFLINNTAWSTSLCLAGYARMMAVIGETLEVFKRVVNLSEASSEHYDPSVLSLKNCPEGERIASELKAYSSHKPRLLQSPYSIRCIPQILGSIKRGALLAFQLLAEEACASTENPVLVQTPKGEYRLRHACNFHSVKAAIACDLLQGLAGYLSVLLERSAAQLLRSSVTGLPEHLAGEGSSVGSMIVHYSMAALSASIRGLSSRLHIYNTPTSGLQEDVVAMTPESAFLFHQQMDLTVRQLALYHAIIERAESLEKGHAGPFSNVQERIKYWEKTLAGKLPPGPLMVTSPSQRV